MGASLRTGFDGHVNNARTPVRGGLQAAEQISDHQQQKTMKTMKMKMMMGYDLVCAVRSLSAVGRALAPGLRCWERTRNERTG